MNIVKIQQDIIKDCLTCKGANWFIQMTDKEALVLTKYQMYIIELKDFLLKFNSLIDCGVKVLTSAKEMLKGADDAKPATKTGIKKQCDKYLCIELKVDDELVYVDEKLLKYYDKSAEFEATNSTSPVYIYEDDILVGMVLPVKDR